MAHPSRNPAGPPSTVAPALRGSDERTRRLNLLYVVLAGFFITNALLAELIGGKLFQVPTGLSLFGQPNFMITLSCGIVLWPVVFIMTDIINEYFGHVGVRRVSLLGALLIGYAFVALFAAQRVPAAGFSPVDDASFSRVFTQSQFIIVGSITAFLLAQLVDVTVFWAIRRRTGAKWLWLRATGSTIISQVLDSYVVGFVGLYVPHWLHTRYPETFPTLTGVDFWTFINSQTSGYAFKVAVALAITPVLYLVHMAVDRYLGEHEARSVIESTAKAEGAARAERPEVDDG